MSSPADTHQRLQHVVVRHIIDIPGVEEEEVEVVADPGAHEWDDSATTPLSTSLSSSLESASFPAAPLSRHGVAFPAPPDHLLLSILVLFLCCPFGAVAVIKSLEAQAARQRGHAQSALVNAALAKRWALLGLTLGLVFNFFGLLMIMTYLCQTENEEEVPVYQ